MQLVHYKSSVNGIGAEPSLKVVKEESNSRKPFIEANTVEGDLKDIQNNHIIPVFAKDNEPVISHIDFIETTQEVVAKVFPTETVLSPSIRLSHPIKGRVPEARNKPASELKECEKTLYYERLAFLLEISSITDKIDGQQLSLCIGGVKAYNQDNLASKKGGDEHFQIFLGFQVSVCTNLCVWSDGYAGKVKVKSLSELRKAIYDLVATYDTIESLRAITQLQNYSLTERQFATLIGRTKMYQHLNIQQRAGVPDFQFGDYQINAVCKDYYGDKSFCRSLTGEISLWKLYNLFTSANKSTYIDSFADKAVNASAFVKGLLLALEQGSNNWFLS
ncbi:MAG: DUF3871 family protein [Flavisolibacter sp.]